MYLLSKRLEIAYGHNLELDYDSPCRRVHGHNGIVHIYCMSEELDHNGMILDFKRLKTEIHDYLDHQYLNEVLPDINPTAENTARWICDTINSWTVENGVKCYKVTFQESEGNMAAYVDIELAKQLYGQGI